MRGEGISSFRIYIIITLAGIVMYFAGYNEQISGLKSLSYTILLEEVLLLFFRHTSEAKNMADFDAISMTTGPKSQWYYH